MARHRSKYRLVYGIRVAIDFEPETFGRLTTIGPKFTLPSDCGARHVFQVCECSCGSVGVHSRGHLISKHTKSCGCLNREIIQKRADERRFITVSNRKLHSNYEGIKGRCYNKNNDRFTDYGGRGIKVCDRWLEPDGRGFLNFLEDMGPKPSPAHSIDRIDVNGNYYPENCRWATNTEQCNNRRNNVLVTANGKTQTLTQWADELGVCLGSLASRVRYGWTDDAIVNTPIRKHKEYVYAIRSKQ